MATRCCCPPEQLVWVALRLLRQVTASPSSSARLVASLRGTCPTRQVASVRLSITFRCGNRLNCWKTIPIRWRIAFRFTLARDLLALEENPAAVDRLEQVDGPGSVLHRCSSR